MKKTADIMYTIGKITTYICIGVFAAMVVIGVVLAILGGLGIIYNGEDYADEIHAYTMYVMGVGIYLTVVFFYLTCANIVLAIILKKASSLAKEDPSSVKPYVMIIICGALAGNTFCILCGIFSLIAMPSTPVYEDNFNPDKEETSDFE